MRRVVSGPCANLKLVRKLKRDWLAAVRREEQCDDVTQAWRFAARSDRAARALAAAQNGVELQPVFVTKRVRARAALGVLAQLGRSIARSVRAAAALAKAAAVNAARRAARLTRSSLRRALSSVVSLITKGKLMSNMPLHNIEPSPWDKLTRSQPHEATEFEREDLYDDVSNAIEVATRDGKVLCRTPLGACVIRTEQLGSATIVLFDHIEKHFRRRRTFWFNKHSVAHLGDKLRALMSRVGPRREWNALLVDIAIDGGAS